MPKPIKFILPDLFSACPFQSGLSNTHYNQASTESKAWANGYDIFTERQWVQFSMSSGELLASHCYPHMGLSVATAIADVFRKNAISMGRKFAKMLNIFDKIDGIKSRRVI